MNLSSAAKDEFALNIRDARALNTSVSMTFTIPNNEIMLKIDYERQHL